MLNLNSLPFLHDVLLLLFSLHQFSGILLVLLSDPGFKSTNLEHCASQCALFKFQEICVVWKQLLGIKAHPSKDFVYSRGSLPELCVDSPVDYRLRLRIADLSLQIMALQIAEICDENVDLLMACHGLRRYWEVLLRPARKVHWSALRKGCHLASHASSSLSQTSWRRQKTKYWSYCAFQRLFNVRVTIGQSDPASCFWSKSSCNVHLG